VCVLSHKKLCLKNIYLHKVDLRLCRNNSRTKNMKYVMYELKGTWGGGGLNEAETTV
jgi:hypothetical protein